jgi:hypothetical protein
VNHRSRLPSLAPLLSVATLFLAVGCAGSVPEGVHVVSQRDKHTTLSEKFPARFINRGDGGDYHVVLLKDRAPVKQTLESPPKKPGAPVAPLDLAAVRQVLHVHVFWNPMRGAKPDNPSATNAALDWYLVRAGTDGRVTGIAHYQGAGFVTTEVDGDSAGVVIRNAALKPTRVEGDIVDPIGPLILTGRFDAKYHPSLVDQTLAQIDQLKTGGPDVDAVHLTEPAAAAARAAR